ncbi:MAG: twin-arginine translocase TatA/TatE family subunit [Candidatus Acidiferrum sp.]
MRLPNSMLSMTHMLVVFIVVLVVFGPQKLPELARGLGKLMAEFRKASTDFKSAFEQEMRDMERQALQAERKKAAEAAAAASAVAQPATLAAPAGADTTTPNLDADTRVTEALVVKPVAEAVPRSNGEPEAQTAEVLAAEAPTNEAPANGASANGASGNGASATVLPANGDSPETLAEPSEALSHDQQRPA